MYLYVLLKIKFFFLKILFLYVIVDGFRGSDFVDI